MQKLLQSLSGEPWLIDVAAFGALMAALDKIEPAQFFGMSIPKVDAKIEYSVKDGIATVPVQGVLSRNTSNIGRAFFGEIETGEVVAAVQRAVMDPEVQGIILAMDSPGGLARGMPEASAAIRQASQAKPVIAHTDDLMASAAYYLASQCSEIVANRSASVGSIGTIVSFLDYSGMFQKEGLKREVFTDGSPFKAMGLPGTTLTDEMRQSIQQRVDLIGRDFRQDVKTARPFLHDSAMRGQVFLGSQAIENGMVDTVGDMQVARRRCKARTTRK